MFGLSGKISKTSRQCSVSVIGKKTTSLRTLSTGTDKLSAQKGLTLVEVMIAFLVLLVTTLALMQTALVSIEANMKNVLRDEAASIAEQRMNDEKSMPFAAINNDAADPLNITAANCPATFIGKFGQNGVLINRTLKSTASINFCTNNTVTALGGTGSTKQILITVAWKWKGVDYSHTTSSIVGQ